MTRIEFGYMLQPTLQDVQARELFDYNRRFLRALSPGFTSLWVEDHLQWGEMAVVECLTTLSYLAASFQIFTWGRWCSTRPFAIPLCSPKWRRISSFYPEGAWCWDWEQAGKKMSTLLTAIRSHFPMRERGWSS